MIGQLLIGVVDWLLACVGDAGALLGRREQPPVGRPPAATMSRQDAVHYAYGELDEDGGVRL